MNDKVPDLISRQEGGLRTQGLVKLSSPDRPLLSIIVAVFNGANFIEETISSILRQDYKNIELIVIDGCSTDGTQNILKQYENRIDYWVSEPDTGISNAFNKGLLYAKGDFINFQGAGDYLIANNAVSKMISDADINVDMLICGRIQRVTATDEKKILNIVPAKYSTVFKKTSLLYKMALPHQALFTNKKMFEKYGVFDESNIFCMDYEHLLRAYHEFPEVLLRDVCFSAWREGGVGTGRIRAVLREYNHIKHKNKIAPTFILFLINWFIIFKYYLRNCLNVFAQKGK